MQHASRLISLFLSFLFLSLFPPHCTALTVSYVNLTATPPSNSTTNTTFPLTTLTLPSVYATVGSLPSTALTFTNFSLLTQDTCHPGNLSSSVLVFTGNLLNTMFSACNNAHQANGVAAARVAQHHSALAIVVRSFDKFESGRVVGFASSITIPVLVLSHSDIDTLSFITSEWLASNVDNLSFVFPAVTSKEKGQVHYIQRLWVTWKACTALIYGFLLILCCYLFYVDVMKFIRRGYTPSTNLAMKAIAVYSMLVSLLWTSVDPFGFDGVLWWKNSLLINLQFSSVVIVFTLILLMWIRAVAKMNFNQKSIVAKVFYGFCAVVWLISFIFGFLWNNNTTNNIYSRGITIIFVLLAISYCIVGKDMIRALYTAKSSTNHTKLILKITLFISWYFALAVGVAIVYSIGVLGPIFELMFTILFEALALVGTFFILFFQPFKQQKKSSGSST